MNLLKEVLRHEVYPALGCTEPISCAYAAAIAASALGVPVEELEIRVDPGTFKNGAAVAIPNGGGEKGNLIAAALGAVLASPGAKLELLRGVTPVHLESARELIKRGKCRISSLEDRRDLRIEAEVRGGAHGALCVLSGTHTHVERIERDGSPVQREEPERGGKDTLAYRTALERTDLKELMSLADGLDGKDREYLRRGIEMNLAMSERGTGIQRTASQLIRMNARGFLADDIFYRTKLRVAAAVDARMAGIQQAVMTSGGSGNQGILAVLTPYLVGREMEIDEERILQSIAIAHLVNAFVKCFTGEISVICGCAMSAGIASAVAIVYQQAGIDGRKITLAVNSVIGDLGGLICDGAKPGCAMKSITAVDTAIRSGLMALEGYGLTAEDGLPGKTAEESIQNLRRITLEGMFQVDPTLLKILEEKAAQGGKA